MKTKQKINKILVDKNISSKNKKILIKKVLYKNIDKELYDNVQEGGGDKIVYIDHHLSHAAGAYLTSPFNESLIFTCDGKGNFKSSGIFYGKGKDLTRIKFQTTFDSIGYFYGNITKA